MERKLILTEKELAIELMSAWVNGWYSEATTDEDKKSYAYKRALELVKQHNNY